MPNYLEQDVYKMSVNRIKAARLIKNRKVNDDIKNEVGPVGMIKYGRSSAGLISKHYIKSVNVSPRNRVKLNYIPACTNAKIDQFKFFEKENLEKYNTNYFL